MNPLFLRVTKHLLPRARAWSITKTTKQLRKFFEGLTDFPASIREFQDLIFFDCFPDTTRELDLFDKQFGLPPLEDEALRRTRLTGRWRERGNLSPRYIQDALQAAGFDVYVHDWFEPVAGYPPGEPVPRLPLYYILDASGQELISVMCGVESSVCGGVGVVCGATIEDPQGYLLVNKILRASVQYYGSGNEEVNSGHAQAVCGRSTGEFLFTRKQYVIPRVASAWRYFAYIGGETFPDVALVPEERRNEFETLVLKLRPSHLWLGMLVEFFETT